MRRKHILITGGKGYIDASLVNSLSISGHEVDILPCRITDILKKSIDVDIIIHAAFAGGGTEHLKRKGWNDSVQMYRTNILGLKTLLDGIKNKHKKIVLLSSSAVYGKFEKSPLLSEEAKLAPV